MIEPQLLQQDLVLETSRVQLRPLRWEDIDALLPGMLEPELWDFITLQIRSREDLEKLIAKLIAERERGEGYTFVVVDKLTQQIVGNVGYYEIVPQYNRLMFGRMWWFKEARGKGFTKDCLGALFDHAFSRWGVNRIGAYVDALNTRSRQVVQKAGCTEEGTLRSYQIASTGRVLDIVVYGILKEEWPKIKQSHFQ